MHVASDHVSRGRLEHGAVASARLAVGLATRHAPTSRPHSTWLTSHSPIMEPRLNALLDLSSHGAMASATNASDAASSTSQRPPHHGDAAFVPPKALMLAASSSPDHAQPSHVRREAHDRIYPPRAMPSAPIAQVLNNEGNLLSAHSVPNALAPSATPFSGRLVDLLLESPEHTKQRWDQDQQFLQPETTGYSPSVIKLPRLPQPPKKTAKRPRIPPLLQGLHQPPPLPPEGRLFPPITGEKNAFVGERGYDALFEEPRTKDVEDYAFFENGAQELAKSAQLGDHASTSQAPAQSAPLGGTSAVQESHVPLSKEPSTQSQNQAKRGKKRTRWSEHETKDLLIGVSRYGIGNWKKILQCPEFNFNNRTAVDLKDRFRVCCPGEGLKPRQPRTTDKEKSTDEHSGQPDTFQDQHLTTENTDSTVGAVQQQKSQSTRTTKTTASVPKLSDLGIHEPFSKTARRPRRPFTAADDINLLKGFEKYGPVWHFMRDDVELDFGARHATDLRDRFRIRYPDKYAKAGYKLKSKEKDRERARRGVNAESRGDAAEDDDAEAEGEAQQVSASSHSQQAGATTSSRHATSTDNTNIKLGISDEANKPKPSNPSTTSSFPHTFTTCSSSSSALLPSHLQYTSLTTTSTTLIAPLKPFSSSSYLSDPLPTLPFSDDEDLTDDMGNPAHNHHYHDNNNNNSGAIGGPGIGDESPITLSRNILRWADANPSSLYAVTPMARYRAASANSANNSGGVGIAISTPSAQAQAQGDAIRTTGNNILLEADIWPFSSAERTHQQQQQQSLAAFKYRGGN